MDAVKTRSLKDNPPTTGKDPHALGKELCVGCPQVINPRPHLPAWLLSLFLRIGFMMNVTFKNELSQASEKTLRQHASHVFRLLMLIPK